MNPPPLEAPLLATREEFPTLGDSVHLISHSLGAMPRGARAHANTFLDQWQTDSIEAWHHHWLPLVDTVGGLIAKVLGVEPGTVTLQQNVSTTQAIVASCLEFKAPRNRVVYTSLNFHTVHYVWQETVRRGAEVVVVPSRDGVHPPMDELLAAIDERTLIVPVSHVVFRSSGVKDVQRLVQRTREVGALLLLDCYQSAGVLPLALGEWGVDLACGGSVKWACGGPGCGYLYTSPRVAPRLEPMFTGWFGHKRPFAFEMNRVDYADSPAWRMANGTPPIPAVATARAGWELVSKLDAHAVRSKSLRQTSALRAAVEDRGFQLRTPREDHQRGGTVCFDFEGSQGVAQELNRRRFFCDWRPGAGIRASPHFYTTDEELTRFVLEIDAIRRAGTPAPSATGY